MRFYFNIITQHNFQFCMRRVQGLKLLLVPIQTFPHIQENVVGFPCVVCFPASSV